MRLFMYLFVETLFITLLIYGVVYLVGIFRNSSKRRDRLKEKELDNESKKLDIELEKEKSKKRRNFFGK